jgi:hypothetical protein
MARPRSALSAFILSLPHDLPVKEVLARVAARGMKASANNVYRVRRLGARSIKVGKDTQGSRRAVPERKGPSVARPIASAASAEDLLRAVAAEVGLGRAMLILAGERARLRALIGS